MPAEPGPAPRAVKGAVRSAAVAGPRTIREYVVSGENPVLSGMAAGSHRKVSPEWVQSGLWEDRNGVRVWRVALRSEGAQAIRIHFSGFQAGSGEVLVFDGHGGAEPAQSYTGAGPFGDGEFWTGAVFSDSAAIEYRPSKAARANSDLPFAVDKISHILFNTSRAAKPGARMAAASCQQDVTCFEGYGERTAKGVALLLVEGEDRTWSCTGSILNSRSRAFQPYLLTANSCVSDQATARTVEAVFNFQSATCDGGASIDDAVRVRGSRLLTKANNENGDFALLLLNSVPENQLFMGWRTAAPEIGETVATVHHPVREHKRIAFGKRIDDAEVDGRPADRYFRVQTDLGRTEAGSTGAPAIVGDDRQIAGLLSHTPSAPSSEVCSIEPHIATYTRFSTIYESIADYIADPRPELLSPADGSTLSGSEVTFTWSAGSGVDEYVLSVGTAAGERDIFIGGSETRSVKVSKIPVDGKDIYVRLFARLGEDWRYRDYRFKAAKISSSPAEIKSPGNNATFGGTNVTFEWSAGIGVTGYRLTLGSKEGGSTDLFDKTFSDERSFVVSGMPMDGRKIYGRLYSKFESGDWQFREYSYRAAQAGKEPAEITSPRPGSAFGADATIEFRWTGGKRVKQYGLDIGNFRGGWEFANEFTTGYSYRVSYLAIDGRPLWVRLTSYYDDGTKEYKDYQYTSVKLPGTGMDPDLRVMDVAVESKTAKIGKTFPVLGIICNDGQASATAFRIGYYFSRTLKPEEDIYTGWFSNFRNGLAARSCSYFGGDIEVPDFMEPGGYYFVAVADHWGEVVEGDESNNRRVGMDGTIGLTADVGGSGDAAPASIDPAKLQSKAPYPIKGFIKIEREAVKK